MKELSVQEKAELYDKAIEVAKRNYETIVQMDKDCTFSREGIINTFHHMFPKLKESEDERIRKCISLCLEECMHKDIIRDCERDECLAWLEKQIEQKEIDYKEEIKKCKDNPLYFFDKYVKVKFKEHKSAWSEDDDYYIERLFCLLNNEQDNYTQPSCDFQEIQEIKKWLKSLKDRYTWKPSDEEMKILLYLCETSSHPNEKVIPTLKSLYQDLKKLREE